MMLRPAGDEAFLRWSFVGVLWIGLCKGLVMGGCWGLELIKILGREVLPIGVDDVSHIFVPIPRY